MQRYKSNVFFAFSVIFRLFVRPTGYGNITPNTSSGRSFCVIYAIIGIPICGVLLSALGSRFNHFKDKILQKAYQKLEKKWQKWALSLLVVSGSGMVFFVFIPAVIFHAKEGWSYNDAVYFCFITLTTIGFGDFVPGNLFFISRLYIIKQLIQSGK